MSIEDTAQKPQDDGDKISLIDLAAALWRRKWLIVAVTAAAAVGSVFYALSKPNLYSAASTMLPISGSSSSMLAQYAGLASLAGVSLPGASASDPTVKLQAILNSRGFAEKLIEKMDLVPRMIERPDKIKAGTPLGAAVEAFQKSVFSVSTDAKTSLIRVSAKTKDPILSRDIANGAVALIQEDLKARTLSSSGKNIVLLQQQVAEQGKKMHAIQDRLAAYQRKNKLIAPSSQNLGGGQLFQNLIQQRIAAELLVSQYENTFAEDNPKLLAARMQLEAIKKQIADYEATGGGFGPSLAQTPSALMEYANISAELDLSARIYSGLLSSLENLKLQEASDKLFIEVIDYAITPISRSEPSRSKICLIGSMAGGLLSVLLAFLVEMFSQVVADPEVRAKFSKGGTKKASVR